MFPGICRRHEDDVKDLTLWFRRICFSLEGRLQTVSYRGTLGDVRDTDTAFKVDKCKETQHKHAPREQPEQQEWRGINQI